MTLAQIAEVTGARLLPSLGVGPHGSAGTGEVDGTVVVDGPVVTDARQMGAGGLYVARVGEHADGHQFVPQALAGGAVAALTTRQVEGLPALVVPDVQVAFERLAHAVLERCPDVTVIAVTGSSGKTSTKDMLAQLVARLGPTVAAQESLNGEVGVPLTILRVRPETRYLVLEMGARGVGHIAALTRIARPDVAVVLNVGSAHLGEFGSVEAIAQAKGELVQGLAGSGVAVLNADDHHVRAMARHTSGRFVLTGRGPDAQVRARDVQVDDLARARFTLVHGEASVPVVLALHGEHQVDNALAVAAVALELGMSLADVADALGEAAPLNRWRMQVTERSDGVTVVNDAYNANPDSMRAALRALAVIGHGTADGGPRRTWAVLGQMLELGDGSIGEHDLIGRLAVRLNISRLVAVGEGARAVHTGAVQEGSWGEESVLVPDVDAAFDLLQDQLRPGDVVLLKSSRDAGLRHLGDRLAAADQQAAR